MEEVKVNSPENPLPYLLNISVLPYTTEELLHSLRMQGIYLSGSSACERGAKSHVISAMSIGGRRAESVLRIGLSRNNTKKEMEIFIAAMKTLCGKRKEL